MYQELIKHIPNNKIELIINDVAQLKKVEVLKQKLLNQS